MKKRNFDFGTALLPIIAVLIFGSILVAYPDETKVMINKWFVFTTTKLGFIFQVVAIVLVMIMFYLSFSKYGKIKLGEGEPVFGNFSWMAMIFCAVAGAGFLYWTSIEWAFYYQNPPLHSPVNSAEALENSMAYSLFHWGPSVWVFYIIPAVAFSYMHYIKKSKRFDVASSVSELLGNKNTKIICRLVNMIFIFAMIGNAVITLGVGTPITTSSIEYLTGIKDTGHLRMIVLCITCLIFTVSALMGLKKGMSKISNISIFLMLAIVGAVFIFSTNKTFIIKSSINSVGITLHNFFHMSLWTDPINNTGFVENWTIFFIAWHVALSMSVSLFIARISKGRTVKNVILGTLTCGCSAVVLFFGVLTGNSVSLTMSNQVNVPELLNSIGGPATVIRVYAHTPLGKALIVIVLIASVLLTATTFDSVTHTLSMVSMKECPKDAEPPKSYSLFWAVIISIIPGLLMLFNASLSHIQSLMVVFSVPVLVLQVLICWSLLRVLKKDFKVP